MSPGSPRTNPFYLVGPTASGKSAIALALAARIGGEIVNVDAFQLYQGMDILSAKPPLADRQVLPHHLYDCLPLTESCDAQRYREMALSIIAAIQARGRVPIIVGGSGLYVKALSHGLATVPPRDDALRTRLGHLTLAEKVAWLLRRDPQAAVNVPLQNPRYVDRALEICLLTGRPQSELRHSFADTQPWGHGVQLHWPREELYDRINQRVLGMQSAGLLEEVRALPADTPNAGKAIGWREMRAHLDGECSLPEAIAAMQQSTRRYAKRQVTWFKREPWLQTICLDSQATAEYGLDQILAQFPCLPPTLPPSRPSLST